MKQTYILIGFLLLKASVILLLCIFCSGSKSGFEMWLGFSSSLGIATPKAEYAHPLEGAINIRIGVPECSASAFIDHYAVTLWPVGRETEAQGEEIHDENIKR